MSGWRGRVWSGNWQVREECCSASSSSDMLGALLCLQHYYCDQLYTTTIIIPTNRQQTTSLIHWYSSGQLLQQRRLFLHKMSWWSHQTPQHWLWILWDTLRCCVVTQFCVEHENEERLAHYHSHLCYFCQLQFSETYYIICNTSLHQPFIINLAPDFLIFFYHFFIPKFFYFLQFYHMHFEGKINLTLLIRFAFKVLAKTAFLYKLFLQCNISPPTSGLNEWIGHLGEILKYLGLCWNHGITSTVVFIFVKLFGK